MATYPQLKEIRRAQVEEALEVSKWGPTPGKVASVVRLVVRDELRQKMVALAGWKIELMLGGWEEVDQLRQVIKLAIEEYANGSRNKRGRKVRRASGGDCGGDAGGGVVVDEITED